MSKKKLPAAKGSIRVIANQDGEIQWRTARENIGDCWGAFSAEIELAGRSHRAKAISKAKREGWRCVQIWVSEITR